MKYEGSIDATVGREEFYARVSEPGRIIKFLPDVVDSKVLDADHMTVKAKVGAGAIRGTLEFAERKPGRFLKLRGRGQGMQSTVDLTLQISFEDMPVGSKGIWAADAAMGGLLASLGGRLIDGLAASYMKKITENIRREVSH